MAISSPGLGSGLDVDSIVSQLVAIERKPITTLQTAQTFIQAQISSFGQVSSLVDRVGTAATALSKATLWSQTSAASADNTVVSASTTGTGTAAAPGSYALRVDQLAQAQSLASAAIAGSPATVGAGKLNLQIGQWAGSSFTPKSGSSTLSLDFTDPATTLEDVRDAINAASDSGVSAAIVRDASGARLTLTSTATGLTEQMRITATDLADAPLAGGLGALAYSPDLVATPGGLSQTRAAANAKVNLNGLDIETGSNQMSGVVDGLTLSLSKVSTTPVSITVSADASAQRKAVQDFVGAYNALNSYLAEQTKYDEAKEIGGTLQGDSTAISLRNQMRGLLREVQAGGGAYTQLSQIGFDVQRDGSIQLNDSKFSAALARPGELSKLFTPLNESTPGENGLARRIAGWATRLTNVDGALSSRSEGLQARLRRNETEQDRLEDRVARVQTRLLRQYSALDTSLSQLNSLSSYVSQQVAAWNKRSD